MKMEQIASTTARMFAHMDRLSLFKHGKATPITFHLAPTDKCQLNCKWCSVKTRVGSELSFEDVKGIIKLFTFLGAKSMELTGGGDPTLYPFINETIEYALSHNLDVGMITNGLELRNVRADLLNRLKWLRISLSAVDYNRHQQFLNPTVWSYIKTFLGCSYVYHEETTSERLRLVNQIAKNLNAKYIRIVPNCYTAETIEWVRQNAPPHLEPFPEMFLQIKEYDVPPTCYWRYFKPFVNSDGYVYQCSTCSLFAGYFPEEWRVSRWQVFDKIYDDAITSFDTSSCKLCFYYRQNLLLRDVLTDVFTPNFF